IYEVSSLQIDSSSVYDIRPLDTKNPNELCALTDNSLKRNSNGYDTLKDKELKRSLKVESSNNQPDISSNIASDDISALLMASNWSDNQQKHSIFSYFKDWKMNLRRSIFTVVKNKINIISEQYPDIKKPSFLKIHDYIEDFKD